MQFCTLLEMCIDYYVLLDFNCVNYDETHIVLHKDDWMWVERVDKKHPECLGAKEEVLGTLGSFIAANGNYIFSPIIVKVDEILENDLVIVEFIVPNEKYLLCGKCK